MKKMKIHLAEYFMTGIRGCDDRSKVFAVTYDKKIVTFFKSEKAAISFVKSFKSKDKKEYTGDFWKKSPYSSIKIKKTLNY